jgi:tetratricopeptide (TPR) repeat protein
MQLDIRTVSAWSLHRVRGWGSRIRVAVLAPLLLACPIAFAQSSTATVSSLMQALRGGDYATALRISDQLLRKDPKSPQLWSLRGAVLSRTGQSSESLVAYQHAMALAPDFLPALKGAAELHYNAKSDKAIPLLRHILKLEPENQTAHAMLGALEARNKDCGSAVDDFAAASTLLDRQPDAVIAYGVCLARLNRHTEACSQFEKLLALRPDSPTVRYDLALEQWRSSAAVDPLTTLQPLLDPQAPDARALRLAAAIHESRNQTPQAVQLLRESILADPSDESGYLDFATLAFTHGSYSVGIDVLTAGLSKLPNSSGLYMARGVLYAQDGSFEKAMDDFERAHKLDPAHAMSASAEGIALSQHHNQAAALEKFRRQVREHPSDPLGYYLLAEALSWAPANGDHQESASTVECINMATRATQLDPRLVQAWDLLASQYLDAEQLPSAIKAARTALKIDPKDQQALYTLILALRKTGSRAELQKLVQTLTEVRREQDVDNNRTKRYGRLVEVSH